MALIRNSLLGAGNFRRVLCGALVAAFCLAAGAGKGTVITFSNIGDNAALPSPYYEGGYTVANWVAYTYPSTYWQNDNPAGVALPFLFLTTPSSYDTGAGGLTITRTGGGTFAFSSVQLGTYFNPNVSYDITGTLSGNTLLNISGTTLSTGVQTIYAQSVEYVDTLNINLSSSGEDAVYLLNDIVVDPPGVPVPDQAATAGLLGLALVPLFVLGVRQRRLATAK